MTDQQFLAAMWQKVEEGKQQELELRRARAQSRRLLRRAVIVGPLLAGGLLALLYAAIALSPLLPILYTWWPLVALVLLSLAFFADGRSNKTKPKEQPN